MMYVLSHCLVIGCAGIRRAETKPGRVRARPGQRQRSECRPSLYTGGLRKARIERNSGKAKSGKPNGPRGSGSLTSSEVGQVGDLDKTGGPLHAQRRDTRPGCAQPAAIFSSRGSTQPSPSQPASQPASIGRRFRRVWVLVRARGGKIGEHTHEAHGYARTPRQHSDGISGLPVPTQGKLLHCGRRTGTIRV